METAQQNIGYEQTALSGQTVLPGFQEIIDCEAAALSSYKYERFCAKVAETRNPGLAYRMTIKPDSDPRQAQKNASKLLKKRDIWRRVCEISAVVRNRDINDVIMSAKNAMNFDPADYVDERGYMLPLHSLPEYKRKGIGLEARIVDGAIKVVPVFASPEKGRSDLMKMMGIEKQLVELTGANGGPIEVKGIEVTFVAPVTD